MFRYVPVKTVKLTNGVNQKPCHDIEGTDNIFKSKASGLSNEELIQ
jgi:hypothetical protein